MTKIQFDTDHQILIITSELPPCDDEFEVWANIFLHHESLSNCEFELGADRHLMRFKFKNQVFNLNFEHYSDSIWISANGIEAQNLLPQLYQCLATS